MFIDADASKSPRRRRISGVYSIEAHRKRRRQDAVTSSSLPPPEASSPGPSESIEHRRRNDAGRLASALRQLGRGATALQVAEDALCGVRSHLEGLRELALPAARADFSPSQRITHGVRFSHAAKEAVALVSDASFDGLALFGPAQPSMVLQLGRVELPLQLVDLSLVPRGLPALSLSSQIGAEAAVAVCNTSLRRVDEGLVGVARLRHDVARIVDGYRHAQRAIRTHSSLPPAPGTPDNQTWPPPGRALDAVKHALGQHPSRALGCQSSSDPDHALSTLR